MSKYFTPLVVGVSRNGRNFFLYLNLLFKLGQFTNTFLSDSARCARNGSRKAAGNVLDPTSKRYVY